MINRLSPISRKTSPFASLAVIVALEAVALCGCSKQSEEKRKDPTPRKDPSAQEQARKTAPEKKAEPLIKGNQFPEGPRLVFLPGEGVGPIRFGATVETIERHMEAKCESVTEDRCLFARLGIEFFLKDGELVRLKAHRRDRKVKDPAPGGEEYFGTVRGILFPKIMLGLHRHIVQEEYGEPEKKEPLEKPGPDGLVDRHFYEGLILEYDKIENGNTVLSAIEIYPSKTAAAEHEKRINAYTKAHPPAAASEAAKRAK